MAPKPYIVTRSIEISAPADVVYRDIEDFHRWTQWSPWEGTDPEVTRTYDGPDAGVGATYRWSGNRKAGAGAMTITEADRPRHVTIALEFLKPFKSTSTVLFTVSPGETDDACTVEWTMTGHSEGFAKVFSFFVPMDKLVGGDFDRGLAALKASAEATATR